MSALLALARQIAEDALLDPTTRLRRDVDRREQSVREELAALAQPLPLPSELLLARREAADAARRLARVQKKLGAAEERLVSLDRPALWAWVSRAARAQGRRLEAAARQARDRLAGEAARASIGLRAAEARLLTSEAKWAREEAPLQADARDRRRQLEKQMEWIADARRVLATSPIRPVDAEQLADHVDQMRKSRADEAARLSISRAPRAPSYRPR